MTQVYKGWYAVLKKDGSTVADCRNISFEVNRNTEMYYGIGSSTAIDHMVGTFEITGSMEITWQDNSYVSLIQDTNGKLTSFTLEIDLGSGSGVPYIKLNGVYIKSISMDITPDDPLTQKVEFVAQSLEVGTTA